MRYGLYVPPFGAYADASILAGLALDAEEAGWDGLFIWDHIAMDWPDRVVDPWIALAAIAVNTQRIRIGPLVTPLSRRRPWKVARETVSLDHLSGGRLTLGVGLGYSPAREFEPFGERSDAKVRAAMLDEALDVVTGLWRGEPFSYGGKHYQVQDALFLPPPVQAPRIPIWVAGFWPSKAPFRRAARWDGVFPLNRDNAGEDMSPGQMEATIAYIKAHRTTDAPFDVVHRGTTRGEDPAQDIDIVAPYGEVGVTWWIENIHPWRFGWDGKGQWPMEAMRGRIRKGPPTS